MQRRDFLRVLVSGLAGCAVTSLPLAMSLADAKVVMAESDVKDFGEAIDDPGPLCTTLSCELGLYPCMGVPIPHSASKRNFWNLLDKYNLKYLPSLGLDDSPQGFKIIQTPMIHIHEGEHCDCAQFVTNEISNLLTQLESELKLGQHRNTPILRVTCPTVTVNDAPQDIARGILEPYTVFWTHLHISSEVG